MIGRCDRCLVVRDLKARGLCQTCYTFYHRKGILNAKARPKLSSQRPWSGAEIAGLRAWRAERVPYKAIALRLGRTWRACKRKALLMGFTKEKPDREPTEEEIEALVAERMKDMPNDDEADSHTTLDRRAAETVAAAERRMTRDGNVGRRRGTW
jgi:hypothetical protein